MRRLTWLWVLAVVLAGASLLALAAPSPPPDLPKPTIKQAEPAAPAAPPGDVIFCVMGDMQQGGEPSRLRLVSRLAAAMAEERPQVVLTCGDYIDGSSDPVTSRRQLDQVLQALSPLQRYGAVPLAAALGNHDRALSAAVLSAAFGPPYYSFNLQQCHFIVLDTQQPEQYGRIEGQQWAWLVQDLQQAQSSGFIFVVMHQPLFPVSVHRGSSLDKYPRFRDRLHQLFVQMHVTCVFHGHEHQYNRQERDGVVYAITGGGGAPLYADELHGGFYHYLRVDVTAGEYRVAVKRLD
jgi:3',5'-cyclic AMP phosphodiesterase CpdA